VPASPPVGDSHLLSCCTRQVNLDNLTAATDLHFPFKAFRKLGVTVCLASYMNSVQPKGKVERIRGNAVVPSLLRFNLGSLEGLGEEVDFGCMRHHRNDLCIFHDSGSGPGGRWFKSIRPDHSSQKFQIG
jgi:hypothetical protein